MKTGYVVAIIILLAIVTLFFFSEGSHKMEGWYSFEDGKKLSRNTGKEMFVFIGTDTCSICKRFKRFFVENKTAMEFIKEHCIPVYVDANRERPVSVFAVPTFCLGYATNLTCFSTSSPQHLMDFLDEHVERGNS